MLRWAQERDYDFVFLSCADTYIHLQRLMNSGFAKHDYIGNLCENEGMGKYAPGGPGHWLSQYAIHLLKDAPVDIWAGDGWVGHTLSTQGIPLYVDMRYGGVPNYPRKENTFITSHIAETPVVYDPRMMYEMHCRSRQSWAI
jgi:hypothetical protein